MLSTGTQKTKARRPRNATSFQRGVPCHAKYECPYVLISKGKRPRAKLVSTLVR